AAHEANDPVREERFAQEIVDAAPPSDARRIFALEALGEIASDAHDEAAAQIAFARCRAEVNARGSVESLYPGIHRAWVELADAARKRDGPAAAEAILKEGFGWFGPQAALLAGLGLCRLGTDDAAGAERLFREALARGPETGQLHYLLALALEKQGRRAAAREELERAISLDPSDGSSRRMLDELSR